MVYIHPKDKLIENFIWHMIGTRTNLKEICENIFEWFDNNISYSRLNAPFYPLQRSDLNVLEMKSGTCGDYSNFLVSVFLALGYEAGYAYVHRDCYGDEQDHICATVKENEQWILIDATLPYRKWHGFHCPHQEYELLSPEEFEQRMKKEEAYWTQIAQEHNNELLAGLLYAPWVHNEVVLDTTDVQDSVFFLLVLDGQLRPTLYAYYQHYTKEKGSVPIMVTISEKKKMIQFSIYEPKSLWDNGQWGEEYSELEIPEEFRTKELDILLEYVAKVKDAVDEIIQDVFKGAQGEHRGTNYV